MEPQEVRAFARWAGALSKAHAALSRAHLELADDLYEEAGGRVLDVTGEPPPLPEVQGKRQRQIVELEGLLTEVGLRTSEAASAIDYDAANTHLTLQALERGGYVEMVPHSKPQRWRLAAKYRSTAAEPYIRAARAIRAGEWATYGDVSIAVRGDRDGARAVARIASTLPQFPNAHRILYEGGGIPPGWHTSDGEGPEECRRRLEEDGVTFNEDGTANRTRVTWDELAKRLEGRSSDVA